MSNTLTRTNASRPEIQDVTDHQRFTKDFSTEYEFDKSLIAELSATQISRMTCADLIRLIRAVKMPLLYNDISKHLEYYDRKTLERLVYLSRRCCRNQGY
ncbi:hypothetical protein Pan161_31780 [Gimesia algae]|uniref:Uncharacterized protein n=1 Tax=Gimesia algae TaxID=2527971 RepID=A0A517VEW0_9PLAN|nr:hypothetical protein Pan161_31780 [Gimesia algae]